MKKVIIGVHGLANKPEQAVLTDYWKSSIDEGLANIGVQNTDYEFNMVYWAGLLYRNPLHRDERFIFDELYNKEPYVPAGENELKTYKESMLDHLKDAGRTLVGETVDGLKQHFGMGQLADWLIGKTLKDLDYYYDETKKLNGIRARDVLRKTVSDVIQENKQHSVMLICHSMGSIISYDVLRSLDESHDNIKISDFVTIGSPLGLPHVKGKVIEEFGDDLRAPNCITRRWVNYADRKDPVAADTRVGDDYDSNESNVEVEDDIVYNSYHIIKDGKDDKNHHKSYGYLRTPELSQHIKEFLNS